MSQESVTGLLPERTPLPALPEPALDRFADLVRRVVGVPTALVTLVDRERQAFPGAVGLPEPWQTNRQTPLTHSFCKYVVADAAPLVVGDARESVRLAGNGAIDDLGVVAYAGMPLTDQSGRTVGSLCAIDGVARDWTERELADLRDLAAACSSELQLRKASADAVLDAARTRVVLSAMPVGFLAFDADWRFVGVNDEAARLTDSTVEEMTGSVLWELFPGSVGSDVDVAYHRVRETGVPERFEHFYPELNIWYEIRVQWADPLVLVYFVDITARLESDTRAERILREMPVGFVGLDVDFRITAANRLGAELVGSSVDDLVGRVVWDLFPGLEASAFGEVYHRVARTGETEIVEAYYPPPLDAWYDVRAVAHQGRLSLFFSDVTERRRIQALSEAAAEHDRTVAQTLQQSLLTALPDVPGIQLAGRYLTAEGTDQVGGDWYDAVVQPDGALAVSVGDVCGHGIEAAAAMGQFRSMLRAFLWDNEETVAGALAQLDGVAHGDQDLPLTTLVSGRIERDHGAASATLVWSNGGHPPPLLVLPDGRVERCEVEPELMIGVAPGARRTDHVRELPAGSTLVLYTDGLVERRTSSIQSGIDRLTAALARHHAGDLEDLLDRALADLHDSDLDDDIAVLAVRILEGSTQESRLDAASVVLDPDDAAPGAARAYVADLAFGLPVDLVDGAVLLTSEAVTNAVRHGLPDITLRVSRDESGLLVSVHDRGPQLPVTADRGALATGGRGLPIIEALASSWGVSTEVGSPGKTVWFRVDETTAGGAR